MCFHEFYLSTACGHHFPKLPPSARPNVFFNNYNPTIAVPQSLTCAPVKLALKFYHDQVVYLPADMNCGAKVELPKKCPIVHSTRVVPTYRATRGDERARNQLTREMLRNGLGRPQQWQIEIDAAVLDRCSNRSKPGHHNPAALRRHKTLQYPQNMYAHVQSVKNFQERDVKDMMPNVIYTNVDFGCGGPFSAECLTGWDRKGLLTHRLHLWSDTATHPKPCNRECLRGWSGAHLDTYRRETWTGGEDGRGGRIDDPKSFLDNDYYPEEARKYVFYNTDYWAVLDYSNIGHLHADQFEWNGRQFVKKDQLPNGPEVHVPETVLVPVPERLDQVLREMSRAAAPGSPLLEGADQASIEDILGRLPEAFDEEEPLSREGSEPPPDVAEDSESASTLVDEPIQEPESTPVETPEMADARRKMARELLRERLKRDFSKGKGNITGEEGQRLPNFHIARG